MFLFTHNKLSKINNLSIAYATFLKVLMRMYTGIFSGYVPIDEERIARLGHYAVDVVEQKLKMLASRGIMAYVPHFRSPLIHFTLERLRPENLRLPQSDYDARRERHEKRVEAMLSLLHEDESTRIETLLAYFGEEKVVRR